MILTSLIDKQRKDISLEKKLTYSDLNRISSNLNNDIFGNECAIWQGAIINNKKNSYISFFFKNKKIALHRILYYNFIGEINDDEYLKFSCENKGICCSLNHICKLTEETDNKYYLNKKNNKTIQTEGTNKIIDKKDVINKTLVNF
jgi:hypothetical protein